jgi:hypothetical protein
MALTKCTGCGREVSDHQVLSRQNFGRLIEALPPRSLGREVAKLKEKAFGIVSIAQGCLIMAVVSLAIGCDLGNDRSNTSASRNQTHTTAETKPEEAAGHACITNEASAPMVPVAVSEAALDELFRASNDQAIAAIVLGGSAFLVAQRTEATEISSGLTKAEVRIVAGPMNGRTGWIPREWLKRCSGARPNPRLHRTTRFSGRTVKR